MDDVDRMALSEFGQRLRDFRLQQGLSQEELAERSGLDRTYVSGVERGKRNVSLLNIHALANALSISASQFFKS